MKEFALNFKSKVLKSGNSDSSTLSDQEYLNQFYRQVDLNIKNGNIISDLFIDSLQNLTILCYQVNFAPRTKKDIQVSYNIAAGYPSGYSERTNYSKYEYLLNPAKYWASFRSLKITVIPGSVRNDLISSTLPMTKNNDGSYSAVFKSLPQKDLSFCLGKSSAVGSNMTLIVGICGATAFVLILLAVIVWRKIKHRNNC